MRKPKKQRGARTRSTAERASKASSLSSRAASDAGAVAEAIPKAVATAVASPEVGACGGAAWSTRGGAVTVTAPAMYAGMGRAACEWGLGAVGSHACGHSHEAEEEHPSSLRRESVTGSAVGAPDAPAPVCHGRHSANCLPGRLKQPKPRASTQQRLAQHDAKCSDGAA